VLKQEELLRDYRPPVHVAPLDPELKRKAGQKGRGWAEIGEGRGAAHTPTFLFGWFFVSLLVGWHVRVLRTRM